MARASMLSLTASQFTLSVPLFALADEERAELLEAESDPRLHGAKGLPQPGGDLLLGVAAEVGQLYDQPLLRREEGESLPHRDAVIEVERLGQWVIAFILRGQCLGGGARRLVAVAPDPAPKLVDGPIAGDAEEPGQEAPPALVEQTGTAPEPQENLLGNVLRQLRIAHYPQRDGVDDVAIPVVESLQGADIVPNKLGDNAFRRRADIVQRTRCVLRFGAGKALVFFYARRQGLDSQGLIRLRV